MSHTPASVCSHVRVNCGVVFPCSFLQISVELQARLQMARVREDEYKNDISKLQKELADLRATLASLQHESVQLQDTLREERQSVMNDRRTSFAGSVRSGNATPQLDIGMSFPFTPASPLSRSPSRSFYPTSPVARDAMKRTNIVSDGSNSPNPEFLQSDERGDEGAAQRHDSDTTDTSALPMRHMPPRASSARGAGSGLHRQALGNSHDASAAQHSPRPASAASPTHGDYDGEDGSSGIRVARVHNRPKSASELTPARRAVTAGNPTQQATSTTQAVDGEFGADVDGAEGVTLALTHDTDVYLPGMTIETAAAGTQTNRRPSVASAGQQTTPVAGALSSVAGLNVSRSAMLSVSPFSPSPEPLLPGIPPAIDHIIVDIGHSNISPANTPIVPGKAAQAQDASDGKGIDGGASLDALSEWSSYQLPEQSSSVLTHPTKQQSLESSSDKGLRKPPQRPSQATTTVVTAHRPTNRPLPHRRHVKPSDSKTAPPTATDQQPSEAGGVTDAKSADFLEPWRVAAIADANISPDSKASSATREPVKSPVRTISQSPPRSSPNKRVQFRFTARTRRNRSVPVGPLEAIDERSFFGAARPAVIHPAAKLSMSLQYPRTLQLNAAPLSEGDAHELVRCMTSPMLLYAC